jgi:Ca2+:H+ antiporter
VKVIYALLLLVPLALLFWLLDLGHTWVFLASAGALIPLAALMGNATEFVAEHTSSRVGGLLNATFGNAAELIITIAALRTGLTTLVKASICGSIIGTSLLILGSCMLAGGLKHGHQTFNERIAGVSATMMILAVVALVIPGMFSAGSHRVAGGSLERLSIGVAIVLIVLYALYILFTIFQTPAGATSGDPGQYQPTRPKPEHGIWSSLGLLAVATVGVAAMAELFVDNVEPVIRSWGVTELFLGVVLVPIAGNVAEHVVAVQAALRNDMDAGVSIAIGSSLQVALFVAPVLVFVSLLLGHPLTLLFNGYELAALAGAAAVATIISMDGESNWLEGAQLLGLYVIVAIGFFYLM